MMTRTIMVVDDEPNMRWVLSRALEPLGYTVVSAATGGEALTALSAQPVDLLLLDLRLKGEDGLAVLRTLRSRWPDLLIFLLTAHGTVPAAVEAMQLGAADVLRKPFDIEEITAKIQRAIERRTLQDEVARLGARARVGAVFATLPGAAPAWMTCIAQARRIADLDTDLLVRGEPATARLDLAHAIHQASARATNPWVVFDTAIHRADARTVALFGSTTLPGVWHTAGRGTLAVVGLADDIALQRTLATQLQNRRAASGPRVIVISDADQLEEPLRQMLPLELHVPPLRDRRSDIVPFAAQLASHPITPAAGRLLEAYDWPGNLAELRAVIERAQALAGDGPLDVPHLPDALLMQTSAPGTVSLPPEGVDLEQVEQSLIHQALMRTAGNKSRAAELLGITRHTLLYRMEKYGITGPER